MNNFAELIEKLGGSGAIAKAIRGQYADAGFVRQWKDRGSIPTAYWPKLIELAAAKQLEGVDEAMLLRLAVDGTERRATTSKQAAA